MNQAAYFEQMRQKRRTEILEAARNMLLKQGIMSFNIQQLARKLDISTVTLYKYFKSSDDILLALKDHLLQDTLSQTVPFEQTMPYENSLNSFLGFLKKYYMEILQNQETVGLIILLDTCTYSLPASKTQVGAFSAYTDKLLKDMETLLINAQKEGLVKSDLNIQTTLQFITMMNQAMFQHIGLIPEENYDKEKKALTLQIEQLISLISLYLTVS